MVTPAIAASISNSLFVAAVSMVATVTLAFGYAYALTRTLMPGRGLFRVIAMLPLFAPSLVQALAFIYVFGNNGIFTRLTDAAIFEEFIQKKYIGAKSFSLEGAESLIPLLDLAIGQIMIDTATAGWFDAEVAPVSSSCFELPGYQPRHLNLTCKVTHLDRDNHPRQTSREALAAMSSVSSGSL